MSGRQIVLTDQDLIPDRALRPSDVDAFDHAAIVENLASHVERGDGPLNIALYGPWGSGKSSAYEMLARRLKGRPVKPVRYDAWRFGGESLQRNFISHAATQLELDASKHRQYHDGLFEGRRHADIDLTDLRAWRRPMVVFAVVLILLLCVVAAVAAAASLLTDNDALTQIGIVISGFFIPAAVGSLVVAAIKAVIDGATVTVEQSRPSSADQFGQRFDELVTDARAKHKADRIVFFIDELDRCSPDDVVATLTAIKTFLDRDDCVFIVAADRQVLEAALKSHLAQATPVDEDHPYYSSASAFLDKVFHHQIYLPPLRPVSLTRFARDLVKERGGVWEEIRVLGGQQLLDDVIYALIPSHVVSPRRVKVLLNNFASNVRIASGRHLYWESRVLEIAKLTVLQTEFPSLAHDLPDAPSLPDLLLSDDIPEDLTPTVQRLLARHALGTPEDALTRNNTDDMPSAAEPPDVLIAIRDGASPAKTRAVEVTQKRDLRRYLERCQARGIVSPKRDLLYLGTLGPTYGLGDTGLAEQLETDAREVPARVAAALKNRSREDREAAAKILGDLSRHEFGGEQANCITAMLGAADVPSLSSSTAARLVPALDEALDNGNLADSDLGGALTVALASNTDEGRGLSGRIVETDALLDDVDRVARVAAILHRLPKDSRPAVVAAVARVSPEDPSVLTGALSALPDDVARELLRDKKIVAAVVELVGVEEPDDSTEGILSEAYAALDGKPRAARALQWTLLALPGAYSHVREHVSEILDATPETRVRTSHAIRGMERAPAADWDFWSRYLDAAATPQDWWDGAIAGVARRVLAEGDAPVVAERMAPFVARLTGEEVEEVMDALRDRLSATEWWTDQDAARRQGTAYGVAQAMGTEATTIGSLVMSAIEADFNRLQETRVDPQQPDSPTMLTTSGGIAAVAEVAAFLPADIAEHARGSVVHVASQTSDPDVGEAAALAIVELSRVIAKAGGPGDVPKGSAIAGAVRHGELGRRTIAGWLELSPSSTIVAALASSQRHEVRGPIHDALTKWARHVDADTRTDVVLALLATDPQREDWIAEIARHGVDEVRVVDDIRSRAEDAGRAEQRRTIAMIAGSLRPADARTRRAVGRLIEALLAKRTQMDHGTAMKLVPSLGRDHQSATAIREALDDAWEADHRLTVGPKDLAVLRAAGIEPKKRNWSDKAKGSNKLEKAARGIIKRLPGR